MPLSVSRRAFEAQEHVLEAVDAHAEVLFPLVFLFVFVGGAYAAHRKGPSRRAFVTVVICLFLVSSMVAVTVFPFTHAQRYSPIADQTGETHEFRMVDEAGTEVVLDSRAITPVREAHLAERLASGDLEDPVGVAEELLTDAGEHRDQLESPVPRWHHPGSAAGYYWSDSALADLEAFETVRVYHVEWTYEDGGHLVENTTESCLLEVTPETDTVQEECDV